VPGRMANIDELEGVVRDWVGTGTIDEIGAMLTKAGIPWGPVNTVADVVRSPQIAAREMMVEVEHPTLGKLVLPGIPIKLSDSPGEVRKPPPLVGEDTEAVFRELLGLGAEEICRLRAEGVV
jgi:crotonobetainyl-CoA:carnitine CoA-transferase CaiB-like acyl-CoA transferase